MATFLLTLGGLLALAQAGSATTLKSSGYEFRETSLGGPATFDAQSANFQATESAGILGIGASVSAAGTQINAGPVTTYYPTLSFIVNTPNVDFGRFSPTQAATATSTFQVEDYTSYGYVVQMVGTPPTNGTHTIKAMGTDALGGPQASQNGIEQFGINLVANVSPVNPLGANPDHGQFGVGSAATNYNTSNYYRFVSGETIASAPKSSGVTTYTISYVVNVSSITPGGVYTGNQTLVCTGTY